MKNINWNEIKTASGTAIDIPKAFEYLKSNFLDDRKKGYWLIDNHAVLQSDLYEAAYFVIDPLFELLRDTKIEEKSLIIDLLIEIAYGYAPPSVVINIGKEKLPLKEACSSLLKEKKIELESLIQKTENIEFRNKLKQLLIIIDGNG